MRISRVVALIVGVLILCLFSSCAESTDDDPIEEENEAPSEDDNVMQYPLTVVDDIGREVKIERKPERVVSFDPGATDILLYLQLHPHVVGVDDYSSLPDEMSGVLRLGGAVNQDMEGITELEPDVVFTIDGMDEMMSDLAERDITTVVLDPESFADIVDNVHLVAEVMGTVDRGQEVVSDMEEKVGHISEITGDLGEEDRPVVFYEVWPDPLMTEGGESLIDFLIDSAGGINAAGDAAGAWVEFSHEALMEIDPDVIITPFSDTVTELQRGDRAGWEELTAVRNERFYRVESGVFGRRSPRLVEGLDEVAQILHPDLFE